MKKLVSSWRLSRAKVQVKRTIRKKYVCPCCQGGLKTAPLPPMLLPKTMASPSLVAYILIAKFADALPLYRQEAIFTRMGGGNDKTNDGEMVDSSF